MNTVIRKHILASRLPDDLRAGIGPDERVTVTVEVELAPAAIQPKSRHLAWRPRLAALGIDPERVKPVSIADISSIAKPLGTTAEDAVSRVRAERDNEDE